MGFWRNLWGGSSPTVAAAVPAPRVQVLDGGVMITTPEQLEQHLRRGSESLSGQSVSPTSALGVGAVYGCVRLISGAVANMPAAVKRRVDERTRQTASDHVLHNVLTRRPNRWQKPAQFKRMMTVHLLLRGNAYAFKGRNMRGDVTSLTPLHPDRMKVEQLDDMSLRYTWTRKDGRQVVFAQDEILHLIGLSLDGIVGVSPITYARESIGASLAMEAHGNVLFKNGASVSGALKLPAGRTLDAEQAENLRGQMDEYRSGGAREGKMVVLEDGLEWQQIGLTSDDAQWIEARKFTRGEIAMFYGVPPHMIGDTDKATSWGTGLDSQGQNFVTYTMEDYLTAWEEGLTVDCLDAARDDDLYVRFNRNALVRGDLKTRWEAYTKALQWGVFSPNMVLEMEDMNPREGGDIFYPPPNMTATTAEGSTNVAS
jgi:HK97 family phage portal protein